MARKRATHVLTDKGVRELAPGKSKTEAAPRGQGALQARKLADGSIAFYYRYTSPEGVQARIPLGSALSLAEARKKSQELAKRYQSGSRDLRTALDAEEREAERERKDAERIAAAEAIHERATLGALLSAYVAQLRRDGKTSARQVERSLEVNVKDAWPKLWEKPAADVTDDDLLAVVARLADANKLRGASKVRTYLRAAYAAGIRARHNARAIPELRALAIRNNPAASLANIEGEGSGARDRALSVAELQAYWRRIVALPDPEGALLRFHLLSGAQRVEQLARLTIEDFDKDSSTVRIKDGKGRRRVPRVHIVPLLPEALSAMRAMRGDALGSYLFTVTEGHSGASYAMAQHRLRAVAQAMHAADELQGEVFTLGDLRRTVETRLAACGISMEIRAQLQSHGLGGVQAKHYDRHDYLAEKLAALETLHRLATGNIAAVVPIRRKAK